MTSFRRPEGNIGRSEYQLRMPFPGNETPEGIRQNFRELERWGNNLPLARTPRFVPYMVTYQTPSADYAVDPEITLSELWQAKYSTDLVPTGTWIVQAQVFQGENIPLGTVGMRGRVEILGSYFNSFLTSAELQAGYYAGNNAIRVVDDVDFITPEVTYKWMLPDISDAYTNVSAQAVSVIGIGDNDGGITVRGSMERSYLTDPDVGPDTTSEYMLAGLIVFAYRLTDGYTMPLTVEDITP